MPSAIPGAWSFRHPSVQVSSSRRRPQIKSFDRVGIVFGIEYLAKDMGREDLVPEGFEIGCDGIQNTRGPKRKAGHVGMRDHRGID